MESYIATALLALLPLLGVIVGSYIQYVAGRTLEARKQLGQERARAYADYFRAIASISTQGRSGESLTLAADAKTRICIYGSAKAIGLLSDFQQSGTTTSTDNGRAILTRLMQEVRRDLNSEAAHLYTVEIANVLFGTGISDEPK